MKLPYPRMSLLRASTWLLSAAATIIVLLQTSCVSAGGAGITIYDIEANKSVGEVPSRNFRELVRTEAHPDKAFFTMTEEGNHLIIRKRDANGAETHKVAMPIVNTVWHEPHWCALNDLGDKIAYHDKTSKLLKLRNLKTGVVSDMASPTISSAVNIRLFNWIGDDTLVLVRTVDRESDLPIEISVINILTGKIRSVRSGYEFHPNPTLSPDGTMIAGVVADTRLDIFDIRAMSQKTVYDKGVSSPWIMQVSWSADSEAIFTSIGGNMYSYCLATKAFTKYPLPVKEGTFVLEGFLNDTIAATVSNDTWIFDTITNAWRKIIRSNGSVTGIRGTTRYVVVQ